MNSDVLTGQAAILTALDRQFKDQPNVGFMLIYETYLNDPGLIAVLKENFEMVANATTWYDQQDYGLRRLILRSSRFTDGWGKYEIKVVRETADVFRLLTVSFVL